MLTETVSGRTYDYSHNVGRGAQSGMGFNNPVSMTLAPDGTMYVANRGSESISNVGWNRTGVGQRITKLTIGAEWGEEEFVGEFSRYGNGKGQFIWPAGIATDSQGQVFVTDEWLNRVTVFEKEGDFVRSFDTVQPGDGGAALMFGDAVNGGQYSEFPSMEAKDLEQGDVVPNYDFRGLYTTVVEDWMGLDGKPIVDGEFEKLPIFA